MKEIWKPVVGYEENYSVSNFGNILSHTKKHSGKIKKPITTKSHPYLMVQLCKNGKRKTHTVHRLVALAFIENPHSKREVNHIDSDPTNNRADNLEWMTPSENTKHSFTHGKADHKGEKHPGSKLNNIDVLKIRERLASGDSYLDIARSYGVHKTTIRLIKKGISWSHI